jgi:hypothetical protein
MVGILPKPVDDTTAAASDQDSLFRKMKRSRNLLSPVSACIRVQMILTGLTNVALCDTTLLR